MIKLTKAQKEVLRILNMHKDSYIVSHYRSAQQKIVSRYGHELYRLYRVTVDELERKGVIYKDPLDSRCAFRDRGKFKLNPAFEEASEP